VNDNKTVKGRGAQSNTSNPYLSREYGSFEKEGIDEEPELGGKTQILKEYPRKMVNKVASPDLGFDYSMNPYQGCEHGCVYCYARNTHHYWGYSAGIDFEQKIIVKPDVAQILEKQFSNKNWKVSPIMLSGNTDCYQPQERKLKLTRSVLEVLLKYRHPVGIITKNDLIIRDIDLLKELNDLKLVNVAISINSLNEKVRRKLEPRTATYSSRLKAIESLSNARIPVHVMVAPVIPGLTSEDIPKVMKAAHEAGAKSSAYIILRLNGAVGPIFEDWARKHFPDRADRILHQVAECHGGKISDSRFGKRMRGEGNIAQSIKQLFDVSKRKYFGENTLEKLNCDLFIRGGGQLNLFT
jgi:DNA repair photolyase